MTICSVISPHQAVRPVAAAPPSATPRAADGDYLTKGAGHTVKDADGEFKPGAPGASAAATAVKVPASVRAALASLTKGDRAGPPAPAGGFSASRA